MLFPVYLVNWEFKSSNTNIFVSVRACVCWGGIITKMFGVEFTLGLTLCLTFELTFDLDN